jgi:hypothetical protein
VSEPTCLICGQGDHRYGTTDSEHRYDAMGCVNMLLPALDAAEAEITRLRAVVTEPISDRCMDCGGYSPYWHASNDLWDRVVGDGERQPGGIICPSCFTIRANAKDLPESHLRWIWSPEPLRMVPDSEVLDAYERRRAAEAERDETFRKYTDLLAEWERDQTLIESLQTQIDTYESEITRLRTALEAVCFPHDAKTWRLDGPRTCDECGEPGEECPTQVIVHAALDAEPPLTH